MRHFLVLALAGALAVSLDAVAEPIGFLAVANGDVHMERGGSGTWQAAHRDAELEIGDAIRTGPGASAKIVLVDDTLLQVDEDTELRIESYHVGAAATQERSIVRQARGRLRATVGEAFGGSTRLEVHIPTSAIGVKGTDFEVVKQALWEACLLSGGIVVTNRHGFAEPRPGHCVYAYGDRKPGDEFPNPRDPLRVRGDEGVASGDFSEGIEPDVAAEGDGGGPPGGNGLPPLFDDELENFGVPQAPEPPDLQNELP